MLMSARSSQGPLKLQDLTPQCPHPGVCIYLDPEESKRLGTSGSLHFRYKKARLQALETMANTLKKRIDILTAKLHKSEAPDALRGAVSNPLPSSLSSVTAAPTPTAPVCSGALVPNRGRGMPSDWADTQARPLVSPTCFPDSKTLSWNPDRELRQSVSPGARCDSQPRGFMEDGCLELDNRLAGNTDSFQALRPFLGSSLGVTAMPGPTRGSLQLEEIPSARGAGLLAPWTTRSCGRHSRHLANVPQKSLGFLKSLKLDQQKQKQALALLRQRAEQEVWETQKALDKLLFNHRVQQPMGKRSTQARPKPASARKQPQVFGGLEPRTCLSTVTARPRSHPAQGRAAATSSQDPQEGRRSQEGKSAPAEPRQERPDQAPFQLPLARLYPQDNPTRQMLDLSLRDEELRAQHQAALLRLREKVLEEKVCTELAWLEHQRQCLGSEGKDAMLAALAERQEQVLSKLEQEQGEIRYLRDVHLFSHQERKLLLQHQKDLVSLQRSMVHLQQELQAWTRLPQTSGLEVKATQTEEWETSVQLKGPAQGSLHPSTLPRPGSPASHCPRTSPETPRVQHLLSERADGMPPQAASAVDSHRPPPRPAWGEDTAAAGSWPDAGCQLAESHSPVGQADPQTNTGTPSAEEKKTRPLTDGHAQKLRGPNSLGGGRPCSPLETSVVEGRISRAGSELGLDFADSPVGEPHRMEGWRSGEQRTETCGQDPCGPFSPPEAAPPAPEPPTQPEGSPLPQLRAPSDLGPESEAAPRSRSGSWAGSGTSSPSGLSCGSLQEFQRASAVLVHLSESPISMSDREVGDIRDTDPGCSGEFAPEDSWGLHRGRGQVAWEKPEGSGAGHLCGFSAEAGGVLREGWLLPPPDAPSPRSGSELSQGSSEIWDEENLLEPGSGAEPASGRSSSIGGSSHLENGGAPGSALASLGPGEGQEASRTPGSLIGLTKEKVKQISPEAACMPLPSKPSSSSDLDLSLSSPSGSLASEGGDLARGETRPRQASAGCPEGSWDAALSLPSDRKPQQSWSEPEVPVTPQASPGDPGGLVALIPQGWAPRRKGSGDFPAPEEACLTLSSRVLPEILSPVDEVLSYGSADLSSAPRDARLPPLPPTFPAEGLAHATSPSSEDFPSPPEDVMSPGGSLGPLGEDASIQTGELASLSEEATPEAPPPGPHDSGLCVGAGRQGGSLGDKLGESSSVSGDQAVGSQWSEPACWLGSSLRRGAGDAPGGPPRLPVQPPTLSRLAFMAAEGPPMPSANPGPAPAAGPCADLPGVEGAQVVDLVSGQLSRRILCDTLAVLLEQAQPAAP